MDQVFVAILGGGSVVSLLGVLATATLRVQKQQGEQIAEWRAIVLEKDKQLDAKDRQITRLEGVIERQVVRITELEARVTQLERKVPNG